MVVIDLNQILDLEDVRLQEINSIETYIIELTYMRRLLSHHIERCEFWKENKDTRPGLGKLHEFLTELDKER